MHFGQAVRGAGARSASIRAGDHHQDLRSLSRGALERVHHDQQLHQVEIHRAAAGLHDEDVGATYIFQNLIARFAVAEFAVFREP